MSAVCDICDCVHGFEAMEGIYGCNLPCPWVSNHPILLELIRLLDKLDRDPGSVMCKIAGDPSNKITYHTSTRRVCKIAGDPSNKITYHTSTRRVNPAG